MNLTPNPFDADHYPDTGVLYVRTDTGVLIRINVAVGVDMFDSDNDQIIFTGTNLGPMKVVPTAR